MYYTFRVVLFNTQMLVANAMFRFLRVDASAMNSATVWPLHFQSVVQLLFLKVLVYLSTKRVVQHLCQSIVTNGRKVPVFEWCEDRYQSLLNL